MQLRITRIVSLVEEAVVAVSEKSNCRYCIRLQPEDLDYVTFQFRAGTMFASHQVSFWYELNPLVYHLVQLMPPTYNPQALYFNLTALSNHPRYHQLVAEFIELTGEETFYAILSAPLAYQESVGSAPKFEFIVNEQFPTPELDRALVDKAWDSLIALSKTDSQCLLLEKPYMMLESPLAIAQIEEPFDLELWFCEQSFDYPPVLHLVDLTTPKDEIVTRSDCGQYGRHRYHM